jgi:hypothetical protein
VPSSQWNSIFYGGVPLDFFIGAVFCLFVRNVIDKLFEHNVSINFLVTLENVIFRKCWDRLMAKKQ